MMVAMIAVFLCSVLFASGGLYQGGFPGTGIGLMCLCTIAMAFVFNAVQRVPSERQVELPHVAGGMNAVALEYFLQSNKTQIPGLRVYVRSSYGIVPAEDVYIARYDGGRALIIGGLDDSKRATS